MDIATRRLHSQRLAGDPLDGAAEVVGWLGAVQSQDYPAAAWALGQRARDVTAAGVHQLFDAGAILRTHLLRPTWHLVLPADIRWLLALTGPRIRAGIAGRLRRLEIDGAVITRAETAFTSVLAGGRQLTRVELAEVLRAAGIAPDGQRLPHLILAAELDALVVSGPRRGREFTYMLLDERVPARRRADREEGLSRLAERYFRSRGPAQLQDFAWWAGVTLADTRAGVAGAGSSLASEVIGGTRYWFDAGARPRPARATLATSCRTSTSSRSRTVTAPRSITPTGGSIPPSSHSEASLATCWSSPAGFGAPGAGWWVPNRCACRFVCSTRSHRPSGQPWPAPRSGWAGSTSAASSSTGKREAQTRSERPRSGRRRAPMRSGPLEISCPRHGPSSGELASLPRT
jgi:hypothetical protein